MVPCAVCTSPLLALPSVVLRLKENFDIIFNLLIVKEPPNN